MGVWGIVLDVFLFAACIAAVTLTVFNIFNLNKTLKAMPPYKKAAETGKVEYKLSGLTQNELTNTMVSTGFFITEEMEYEAYRQAKYNRSLITIFLYNLPFTIISALCCCFDGFTTESDTLPATFVVWVFILGFVLGIGLGFLFGAVAHRHGIVKSRRWTGFINNDGSLLYYGRFGDAITFVLGIFIGWLIAATLGMSVYTIVVMCL